MDSPALFQGNQESPAYEVKFVVSEALANEIERRLRPHLVIDPHGDPARNHTYRITSVYFDTPNFDVYLRSEGYRVRKYRLRRYNLGSTAFLERKAKRSQQVRKRRTALPIDQVAAALVSDPGDWEGAWFVRQLAMRQLQPVCRVTYDRLAFIGESGNEPIRLTFDRSARGAPASGPHIEPVENGVALLHDEVIVEFKFIAAMPVLFKSVVEDLGLAPKACSKFRRCFEALGVAPSANGGNAGA